MGYNPYTGQYEEDDPGANLGYVEDLYQKEFGGSIDETQAFLRDNPGDLDRLRAGAFSNEPGQTTLPPSPGPTAPPPPGPGPTPPPGPGPTRPPGPGPLPPVRPPAGGGGGDYSDFLRNYIGRGFQPQQQYGEEVMRLMRLQEGRAAQDAARRAAFEDQLRTTLMDLIRRGQEPVDADAIGNSQEAKSFARVQERAMQRYRAQAAEQRAAQGIGQNQRGEVSGALGSDIQGGQSELAEKIAAFESRLVAEQINNRRQQLMQALQLGAGMLSGEQSNAIRRELAQLDAALQRETFHADLGLRGFLGGGQLSLGLLGAMNQNQQFDETMRFNKGVHDRDWWLRKYDIDMR